jgi:hypothetical protein
MLFYKGVLLADLNKASYVPGTVTTKFNEALMWKERIESNKSKGVAKHVKHGKAVIIEILYDEASLADHFEFQRAGVTEHERINCWLSQAKDKAQINTAVNFKILTESQINNLFKPF